MTARLSRDIESAEYGVILGITETAPEYCWCSVCTQLASSSAFRFCCRNANCGGGEVKVESSKAADLDFTSFRSIKLELGCFSSSGCAGSAELNFLLLHIYKGFLLFLLPRVRFTIGGFASQQQCILRYSLARGQLRRTTSLGHYRMRSHVTLLFSELTILISDDSTDEDESRMRKVLKLKKLEAKTPGVSTTATAIDENTADLAWPWTCKYFVPHVMDASTGPLLIDQRSRYIADDQTSKQNLKYLDIGAADPQVREVLQDTRSATSVRDLLALSSLPSQHTRIFFLGARRHYNLPRETYCSFTTTAGTWRQFLDAGNVPPSAVELLYDRNGGYWSFTTYCSNNKCPQSSSRSD